MKNQMRKDFKMYKINRLKSKNLRKSFNFLKIIISKQIMAEITLLVEEEEDMEVDSITVRIPEITYHP